MPPPATPPRPWLVAAWPGMGNVAIIAANVLIHELGLEPQIAISPAGFFDIAEIHVASGLVERPRMPRSVLHRGTDPATRRGLLVFTSEAQPTYNHWAYASGLLDKAIEAGVERIVTFASMASTVHPTDTPKVHGAATTPQLLEELKTAGVKPVQGGQIGGLNGVLLGAAMERGIPAMCLMGEIPFYAANLPNPKASRVVLSVFSVMTGMDIALADLDAQAKQFEGPLTKLFERLREQAQEEAADLPDFSEEQETMEDESGAEESEEAEPGAGTSGQGESGRSPADAPSAPGAPTPPESRPAPPAAPGTPAAPGEAGPGSRPPRNLHPDLRARIERLFEDANIDRKRAVSLKEELDRLGVFEEYEDRFLDLFKRAE